MSGGQYPQQPGGYPQQPGGYPQQPGGYQQQPYGHHQQGYGHAVKAHRGAMLLVFSILPWVIPCVGVIFAIIAFFMAKADLQEMKQGIMDRNGEGLTTAAFWISLITMILMVLGFLLYVLIFAAAIGSGGMEVQSY